MSVNSELGDNGAIGLDKYAMTNIASTGPQRRLLWIHWATVVVFTALTLKFVWSTTAEVTCVLSLHHRAHRRPL
jgi:hypothetical protein